MATQSAALSDEQLSATRLEIDDPLAMPRLSVEKPCADLEPQIVGEYHLGKDQPRLWCCHCQGHRHHNGFVITNSGGANYLIGSKCGPDHYGLSFKFAEREHKAKVKRKGVLDRLKGICETAEALKDTVHEILHSEGLKLIDQKRGELIRASDSTFSALAVSVRTESLLYEMVQVRDLERERRRDEQLPPNESGPPIYREERMPIGRVAGTAILRETDDCRAKLLTFRRALERAQVLGKGLTDDHPIKVLMNAVRAVEEAYDAAQASIIEAESAPAFFGPENLGRLERWSATNRYYRLTREGADLIVTNQHSKRYVITPLPPIKLPRLPSMKGNA
jgi:hypothetical protein